MTTHTSIITLAALASLAATALTPTTSSARAGGTPGGPAAAVGSTRSMQKPGPAFRMPGTMLARNHGSAQPTVPAKPEYVNIAPSRYYARLIADWRAGGEIQPRFSDCASPETCCSSPEVHPEGWPKMFAG